MALGKHVFCQKPLTHTVEEAHKMRHVADEKGVITQMGNQIQSHHAYRTAVKLLQDGAIGKVREVHAWQAGDMDWLITDKQPDYADPVPDTLDWNLWLGVAPSRQYIAELYHPKNWRAWQDFSNGQLGDFGCHILDPVFMALGLTAPTAVKAEASPMNREVWYKWSVVNYEFPGTDRTAGRTLRLTWYDGEGKMPPRDRQILNYNYFDDRTLREIGLLMNVHEATISRWLAKAQREIKRKTEEVLQRSYGLRRAEVSECIQIAARTELDVRKLIGDVKSVAAERAP